MDEIPQARWFGTVGEDVSQMRVVAAAHHFHATHAVRAVHFLLDGFVVRRLIEAGPSGAGFVLGRGIEERLSAADADKRSLVLGLVVLAGEGALGALAAGDPILFFR